ncbi:MAG: hypothetical protein H7A25_11305 [Leptospiraceae bacterium]|nr:hypothetical protein [Leptospiraceae bacterium]MCP5500483.1 hypothetical protein [Leptospiraceae bacterium]
MKILNFILLTIIFTIVGCSSDNRKDTKKVSLSDYQGAMGWEKAKKKCEDLKMRIPGETPALCRETEITNPIYIS